jgi:hypothetical protein
MFDFRYHVASLAAVFIALIIGILVGVGISGTGFVKESERDRLNRLIDDLRADRDAARGERDQLRADATGAESFLDESYPLVMDERLRGKRIAVVSIGAIPPEVERAIGESLTDADATLVRTVVLTLPGDMSRITAALRRRPALDGAAGRWSTIGSRLGKEVVRGQSDLLTALEPIVVQERSGSGAEDIDGVVVVGQPPAQNETPRAELTRALYRGLAGSAPSAAVEARGQRPGTVAELAPYGFATIDDVDTRLGRVALAGVLAGDGAETKGKRYGTKATAEDGPLPPLLPVQPAETGG